MNQIFAERIFREYNFDRIESFEKIEVGFTNKVYLVNNKFILKICEKESNEEQFEREVYFYNFFKNKICVPEVKIFDKSKSIYNRLFIIYPKIEGDNLYAKWHLFSNEERKSIIRQLCNILKIINGTSLQELSIKSNLIFFENWKEQILNQIQYSLITIEQRKILSYEFLQATKSFIADNQYVLNEQKIALVYWDAHFDNVLVQGTKIVGLLDFERTELASIDFILDILKRMTDYPKKYMSAASEEYAQKKDYVHLLDWFQEYYPALFDFKDLDSRLDLYTIKHDLDTLIAYPDSLETKQIIAKIIGYNFDRMTKIIK